MTTELYVENYQVDITSSIDALMTFAIDDIKDFGARNTSFSKTIIIPGTQNNNKIFGNIFDIKSASITNPESDNINANYNIARSAKCILFQSNMQIFKGIIRIMQIVIENNNIEYECTLFGELGGLVSAIGNKKLTDLDLSRHNHTYSIANMVDTWDTTCLNTYTGLMDFVTTKLFIFGFDMYQVEAGDTITITNASTNNGTYVVSSSTYDAENDKTIIVITTTFPLGANFIASTISINKIGFGFNYPLIDYGTYSTGKVDWIYKTFKPAVFVYELLYLIFKNAGYKFSSTTNFLSSALIRRLIVPYNQKNFLNKAYVNLVNATKTASQTATATSSSNVASFSTTYQTLTTLTNFTCVSPFDTFTYTGTLGGHVKINLNVVGTYLCEDNGGSVQIRILKLGTNAGTILQQYLPAAIGVQSLNLNLSIDTDIVTSNSFRVQIFVQTTATTKYLTLNSSQITIAFDPPQYSEYLLGDTIKMNDILPSNILQKDFLSSIMKMFNLYLYEDKDTQNLIKIDPYVNFYDTTLANIKDWTYKVDQSKPMVMRPMSELNARYYKFKYKDDSDYYNDQYRKRYNLSYGSYIFDTEFEFAKDDTNIEVIFSGTPLVGYDSGQKIYPTIFKRSGTTEETIDSNIRILQIKQKTGVNNWYLKDTNGTTNLGGPYTYYPYAGHFDDPQTPSVDINFGIPDELYYNITGGGTLTTNLFTLYWIPYMYEIIDETSRLLTLSVKLNEVDILQLDFSKLVYIDGVVYRLNKIIDYNATTRDTCKIELLKTIQLNY